MLGVQGFLPDTSRHTTKMWVRERLCDALIRGARALGGGMLSGFRQLEQRTALQLNV